MGEPACCDPIVAQKAPSTLTRKLPRFAAGHYACERAASVADSAKHEVLKSRKILEDSIRIANGLSSTPLNVVQEQSSILSIAEQGEVSGRGPCIYGQAFLLAPAKFNRGHLSVPKVHQREHLEYIEL